MIAADTSAWIDFSRGYDSPACKLLERALEEAALLLPMPVLFELLSAPGLQSESRKVLLEMPRLELTDGFWERAAELRQHLLKKQLKARSIDVLIAQNCIDHKIPLLAADTDFRHFAKLGLTLASF